MIRKPAPFAIAALLCLPPASAHYLWVSSDGDTMNLVFEESPVPRDGKYLGPFVERGKSWVRTLRQSMPTALKLEEVSKDNKRWLTTTLATPAPRVLESYGKWGVYRYGKTDVLLHYYAKSFDVSSLDQLAGLSQSHVLDLDVRPAWSNGSLQLQVVWRGKPAAHRPVIVRGPKGFKANLKTDDKGLASFAAGPPGRYLLRTYVEEKQAGTFQGKSHELIRHHATVLATLRP